MSSGRPGERSGDGDLDLVRVDREPERGRTLAEERRWGTELGRRAPADRPEDGVAVSRFTQPGTRASAEIAERSNPPELKRRTLSFLLLLTLVSTLGR